MCDRSQTQGHPCSCLNPSGTLTLGGSCIPRPGAWWWLLFAVPVAARAGRSPLFARSPELIGWRVKGGSRGSGIQVGIVLVAISVQPSFCYGKGWN